MFSELLQQLLPEIQNSDIEELTETLQKSTVDVLHILSQMSIYSTVERNAYDTNAVDVRFPLLIQNEVNKLREKFQQKKITLRFMQDVPDISFKTYVKSLGFIFSEMLQNAWKFSPIHSIVAINIQSKALSNQQLLIRISVRDQGAGIKQEESHKIGVPFTKLSSKPTNNEPSAGLGLAISSVLAQQLQGKLHFDFRQQIGCTVHFDFTVSI
jgi:signal transduction histidine kinase